MVESSGSESDKSGFKYGLSPGCLMPKSKLFRRGLLISEGDNNTVDLRGLSDTGDEKCLADRKCSVNISCCYDVFCPILHYLCGACASLMCV